MKFKIFGKEINLSILNKEEKIITNQEDTVKNTIYSPQNNYITIIFNNGDIIADKIEKEQVDLIIRGITTKKEVIGLLQKEEPKKEVDSEEEIKSNVKNYLHLFKDSEDFIVLGEDVYFKNISNIAIPSSIVASFLEILDKGTDTEEYISLKYFTLNLLMNPIKSAREDCLQFVKDNDIKITSNGLLVCYRKIVSKENTNKEWNDFVSENYIKVKKWKKNPYNYEIYKLEDELFISNKDTLDYDEHLGNLKECYINLATTTENIYTDNHTRKKQIKIGTIYREDEDKIDLDNTVSCSRGLHVGSKEFSFSGFGDTGVMALVNPIFVRSVPKTQTCKMRVSEMFICGVLNEEDYNSFEDIIDFSEEYITQTLEELTEMLSNRTFEKISCQENIPNISPKDIKTIIEVLQNRIQLV